MTKKHSKERNAYAAIVARAWKDPAFKTKLLKHPKEAFKEVGIDLPPNVKIHVIEDKPDNITFVLPPAAASVGEMSDQELEKVAGGLYDKTVTPTWALAVTTKLQGNDDLAQFYLGGSGPK